MEDKIKELEYILEGLIAKRVKLKNNVFMTFIILEISLILSLIIFHYK